MVDKKLLDVLACPKCKSPLIYDKGKNILVCKKCNVYYEVIEDIPVLLINEAKPLSNSQFDNIY